MVRREGTGPGFGAGGSRPSRRCLLAAAAVLALGSAGRAEVVVVEARPGGEAAKAKLKPGDRLVSWRRAATKTAPAASGTFRAPWEVDELELARDPEGVSAAAVWNSLGVIRKQRGDLAGAEEAYGRASAPPPRGRKASSRSASSLERGYEVAKCHTTA